MVGEESEVGCVSRLSACVSRAKILYIGEADFFGNGI